MADKCCGSNINTENQTESCCSSSDKSNVKQENSGCCTSNKDSVNSFKSIPIIIKEKTSCCSHNASKKTGNELEKVSCCSTSLPSENKQETNDCCSSQTTSNEDKN